MYRTFLGRTIETSLSMQSKIAIIISSSFCGAGLSSGCVLVFDGTEINYNRQISKYQLTKDE